MRDVAAKAGVSATVVSHVLNDRAAGVRVSVATAERVRQAALDLGYRMNVMARNFRERQTLMVGVIHGIGFSRHRLNRGPRYFAAVMDGIIDGAFEHGYSVALCPKLLGQSPEHAIADGRFDGLVWYSSSMNEENRHMLERCSVPLVMLHTPSTVFDNRIPSVICDNDQGVGLGVQHLVELGHRRIAFACAPGDDFGEGLVRRNSFFRHCQLHGISASENDVIVVREIPEELGETLRLSRYTAILCVQDGIAAFVMKEAQRIGMQLPNDLSIVGFDSTEFCDGLFPALTSISQPLVQMGHSAVNLLVQSIRGEAPDPPAVIVPCGLDIRCSTTSIANR